MQAGDILERNGFEGCADIRIIAFRQKKPPKIAGRFQDRAKDRNEGEQALVDEEVMQLLLHKRAGRRNDQPFVSLEHGVVFDQTFYIHLMTEGTVIAPVIVVRLITEKDGIGFQHTGISDGTVLAHDDVVRNTEQTAFQQASPKQLVPQVGGDAEHEEGSKIDHIRVYCFHKPFFVIEAGRKRDAAYFLFVGHDGGVIAVHDVCAGIPGGSAHAGVHFRGYPVVAVHEGDVCSETCADAFLSGCRMAAVCLVQAMDL